MAETEKIAMDMQTMKLEIVSPAIAEEWLKKRKTNFRLLDERYAIALASAIKRNGWIVDGNPIKFDPDGNVVDGQHRLRAIVILGMDVRCWVARGMTEASTLDTGRPRTGAQMFRARGEKYYEIYSSTVRTLWLYDSGSLTYGSAGKATPGDLLATESRWPSVRTSVEICGGSRLVPAFQLAFLHTVLSPSVPSLATEFVSAVQSGAALVAGNPILLLRERLVADKASRAKLHGQIRLALLITCWNKWYLGEPVRQLKLVQGQAFPRIVIPTDEDLEVGVRYGRSAP